MVTQHSQQVASGVRADYDRLVDVLYITLGDPTPVEGDGLPRGVELDWALEGGFPCGVTVIGYRRNGWAETAGELAEIVGRHLSLPPELIRIPVEEAVR